MVRRTRGAPRADSRALARQCPDSRAQVKTAHYTDYITFKGHAREEEGA